MKRILINATHNEEIRVALCKDNHLYDFDLENRTREQKKSNIYKGHVTRVEPSLEAVFVEYGSARQGFLPLREIAPEYLVGNSRDDIKKLIKEGDELIIQVEKEERGNKGAAISTFISLAGRYLVLMPNNAKGGGISRQISGKVRDDMRQIIANLDVPVGMSVIVRTAGIGKTFEDLQTDLTHLLKIWADIGHKAHHEPSPCLLYQEVGVVTRAVRDYLRDDIGEVWIDSENAYNEAASFISAVMPSQMGKLRKYTDYEPLFVRFGIERQIESAYQREVRLPSGGSIVIDQTEALVSIDINSAKSTKGSDVAETAFHTNLEAADEIARQLRLRDMGGLIVIDFIDMADPHHQKEVEKRLIDATRYDRARVQFAEISKFGLMQMSRQRLRPSLEEATGYICPRCHGNGMIRDVRSLALSIMRQIEQLALKHRSGEVQAEVPTEIAAFLLNEKRESLVYLEQDSSTRITILPHAHLESPNFSLHFNPDGFAPASYDRIVDAEEQQNIDRGYEVNWQTRQPSVQNNGTNHWQSEKNKQDKTVKTDKTTKESTANHNEYKAEPAAVAWLSNLFAPKQQARPVGSLESQTAAAAIEAIVNTGAASLGAAGILPTTITKEEKNRPKKDERRDERKRDENKKDTYKPDNRQDKGQKDKSTQTKDKSTQDKAYDKNDTKAEKHPKRQAGSSRPPRDVIEREAPLSPDNSNLNKPNKDTSKTSAKDNNKITEKADHQDKPIHKSEQKAIKGENKTDVQTVDSKTVNSKTAGDDFVMHIKRLDTKNQNAEVSTVHLSLDGSKSKAADTPTTANDQEQPTDDSKQDDRLDNSTSQAIHQTADAKTDADDDQTTINANVNLDSSENPNEDANKETSSDVVVTHAAKNDVALDLTKNISADTDNKASHNDSITKIDQATLNALAIKTGRAKNDPRLIKQMLAPAAITGTAGAFIRATLNDAETALAKEGFVACFIRAINKQSDDDFNFANFGFEPLSETYLADFDTHVAGRGSFSAAAGKTHVPAAAPSPRAKNDPRGEHPALLPSNTAADTSAANLLSDASKTSTADLTTDDSSVDNLAADIQAAQTADTLVADAKLVHAATDSPSDTASLPDEPVVLDENSSHQDSDITVLGDNDHGNDSHHSDDATNDEAKTSPESYKHMIENIAEQLLPQTGILKLNPKKPAKKPAAKKTTKVAIKIPKVEKKPKAEVRKRSPKAKDSTKGNPTDPEQADNSSQNDLFDSNNS